MNKRFFIHKVTFFCLRDNGEYENLIFDGEKNSKVYFRHNQKVNVIDKGLEKGSVGTIIIPTEEKLDIKVDDYVIEDVIEEKFDIRNFSKKYQLFQINSVDDNRKGNLKHYKIGVTE